MSLQAGVCPSKQSEYKVFPFTALPYSPTNAKVHWAWGNVSRFDVRLNKENKKPHCDWHDKDNDFVRNAHKLPSYGFLYFHLFYIITKTLGETGKLIRDVKTADDIDKLMKKEIKTYVLQMYGILCESGILLTYWYDTRCVKIDDDLEPVYKSLPLISEGIRMSVDKMCYMAVYGCRTTLEAKVPASARSQYQALLSTFHKDAESKFVEAWKQWLIDHPEGFEKDDQDAMEVTDASFFGIDASDDSAGEEEGGGEAGAAAPAAGSEASTPP